MSATSQCFLSPMTTTSICSVIIWSSIVIYIFKKMEIESPLPRSVKSYYNSQSVNDVCFNPQSQCLINPFDSQSLILDYGFAFGENKVGVLEKKTLNSSWQNRFFVLTPVRLLYFSSEDRQELKGCFNLASLIQHKLEVSAIFPEISLTTKTYSEGQQQTKTLIVLQILNQNFYNEWLKSLKQTIADIKINLLHLSIFPKISATTLLENHIKIGKSNCNFWNKITISPSELMNYGSHLDIIFLRSKSTFSCIHRFFMRSHYDHVGMLLKDEMEKPYILQVVNDKGVIISPLENLLSSYNEEYEEIGYRKILAKPNLLPLENLENYVNSLIGKKYELTLSKIFLDNETEVEEDEQDSGLSRIPEKPQKTYFCSELIADIYLKFGVLSKGKSNNFWPKDFEEQSLNLAQGYSLTPLMHVELQQEQDLSAEAE